MAPSFMKHFRSGGQRASPAGGSPGVLSGVQAADAGGDGCVQASDCPVTPNEQVCGRNECLCACALLCAKVFYWVRRHMSVYVRRCARLCAS